MCNAWNHSPSCSCGWGGEGHLGRRYVGTPTTLKFSHLKFTSISSYTNPNARCPVCNAAVFFYQSPNGGRVFFDDLGPPWPKHGCTISSLKEPIYVFPDKLTVPLKTFIRQENEWSPLIVEDVIALPPFFLISNLRGKVGSTDVSIYINFKLDIKAPYFIKHIGNGSYHVSTLTNEKNCTLIHSRTFTGYSKLSDLSTHEELKSPSTRIVNNPRPAKKINKIKLHMPKQLKKISANKIHQQNKPNKKNISDKFQKQTMDTTLPTIMQMAFAKAMSL